MSTLEKLNEVFCDVFEDDDINISRETVAADVAGWDSVMNVTLMLELEDAFGLQFNASEVSGLKNVGELLDLLDSKL